MPGARPASNDGHGAFWGGCVGECEFWWPTRESQRYGVISCSKKAARQRYGAISLFAKILVYPPTQWFAWGVLKSSNLHFPRFGESVPTSCIWTLTKSRAPRVASPQANPVMLDFSLCATCAKHQTPQANPGMLDFSLCARCAFLLAPGANPVVGLNPTRAGRAGPPT